jgi:hypothetical protein
MGDNYIVFWGKRWKKYLHIIVARGRIHHDYKQTKICEALATHDHVSFMDGSLRQPTAKSLPYNAVAVFTRFSRFHPVVLTGTQIPPQVSEKKF